MLETMSKENSNHIPDVIIKVFFVKAKTPVLIITKDFMDMNIQQRKVKCIMLFERPI